MLLLAELVRQTKNFTIETKERDRVHILEKLNLKKTLVLNLKKSRNKISVFLKTGLYI